MHASKAETSERLQRVLDVLMDMEEHSTRDIMLEAEVCAVNSCISELRSPVNGYQIACRQKGRIWYYRLLKKRPIKDDYRLAA